MQPRPAAATRLNTSVLDQLRVHTIRTLNDQTPGAAVPATTVVGAGSKIYTLTSGVAATRDTGWSGNPIAAVPWRPGGSQEPWLYMADGTKAAKINTAGTVYQQGIAAPEQPVQPGAPILGQPLLSIIDACDSTAGWNHAGTAGAVGTSQRLSTTIAAILAYRTIAAGTWCAMNLTAYTDAAMIQAGDVALLGSGGSQETVAVHDVFDQSGVITTIAAIQYDFGSTGACTIQPAEVIADLTPGTIMAIGGEAVVITEVDAGPDEAGIQTFRCSTTASHAAGATLVGTVTLVAFCLRAHSASEPFVVNELAWQVTTGTGAVYKNDTANLAYIGGRQVTPSDYVTIAIAIDNLTNLVAGQIGLAMSLTSFSSVPNLNYLAAQFSAGDLSPAGDGQWYILRVPVSSLVPVGVSPGLSLANVFQIGVSITCSGTVNVAVGSWWIGGTYGPLVSGGGQPYQYVYTFASSTVGIESNPSPVCRTPVSPVNECVILTPPAPSSDPQVDTINWYRVGGSVGTWQFVGSQPNALGSFTDVFDDTYVEEQSPLVQDNYLPFPVQDYPHKGMVNVAGTDVTWVSGDAFGENWVPGTPVLINGVPYQTYGAANTNTKMQLTQSAGIQNNVPYTCESPVLQGVPLPSMWGPYQGTTMFACGDQYNPGFLYWTQGNNPDAAGLDTKIEVTSPSEPLIAGCMYNGRAYVFSSKRMFLITPSLTLNAQGQVTFQVQDVPNSVGLLMRTGLCVGDRIYFHGPDGIYVTTGGEPQSLTDKDLRTLFPHEGVIGASVVVGPDTLPAPDYAQPLRNQLAWYDKVLYFDYQSGGVPYTLALDLATGGWYFDVYAGGVAPGVHYGEEGSGEMGLLIGGGNGYVYQAGTGQDNGADMACVISTPAWDEGDPRSRKYYADFGFRVNPAGAATGVSVQPFFDNYSASAAAKVFGAGQGTEAYYTADITGGNGPNGVGQLARNLGFRLSWTEQVAVQILDTAATFVPQPDDVYARGMYISTLGTHQVKFLQGLRIEADTEGVTKTFSVYGDGVLQATFTINHSGQQESSVAWVPFFCREVQLVGDEATVCRIFNVDWKFDVWPSEGVNWTTEPSDWGIPGYKFARYLYFPNVSTADITLTVTVDGVAFTYTIPNTAGLYEKRYVPLQAVKGKLWSFAAVSTAPFRVMQSDLEIWYKGVNGAQYHPIRPFGGKHAVVGAEV